MGVVSKNIFNRLTWQNIKNAFSFNPGKAVPKENFIINQTTVRPIQRKSQDIQQWRMALMVAEQENEQRQLLYDLYSEVLLDGRLKTLIKQRVQDITNANLAFVAGDGKEVPEVTELTNTSAFSDAIEEALNSRMFGHSVLELYWQPPGSNIAPVTNLIDRRHVKPRQGIITQNAWDVTGVSYREAPFDTFVVEVGKWNDLGILLECCPYVIYKRGGFGDWAEFAEVFGMPFRWATYNNEGSRVIIEEALEKAGAAGYVVAPEDAQLQFLNAASGGSNNDIFKTLWQACNEELAVTVLGNSMTTSEARSSGFAQAKVHEHTQEQVHADDRKFILRFLHEKINPYLQKIGYNLGDGKWQFQDGDGLSLLDRIEVDVKVAGQVPIPARYWYTKYGIPAPEANEPIGGGGKKDKADPIDAPSGAGGKKGKKP